MAAPGEKLAQSLEILRDIQDSGVVAIKSSTLSRTHKDRLIKNGFLKEVTKGWLIAAAVDEKLGDSSSWYNAYWEFCADYLHDRYEDDYIISPDQSLLIHTGNWTVPQQLIVRTTKQANHNTPFIHGTSLWNWQASIPDNAVINSVNGLRMMNLESSLVYCTPSVFGKNNTDVRTALLMVRDSSDVLRLLLDGGHTTVAGRLAGAFRNIGRAKIADDIVATMRASDYNVREQDPFEAPSPVVFSSRERSPYINRIRLMWAEMRSVVIKAFPKAPGIPADHETYMQEVKDIYLTDAYHSLSIERYKVTPELIARVRTGSWNSAAHKEDKKQKDAMAARGYWQATQSVNKSIRKVLAGKNSGIVSGADHGTWYSELFAPSVAAGILKPSDLAGYRNAQVYIGGSKHVPVNRDAVRDVMPILFELLENEPDASVRAVLGHFIFVFIHPYMDGNGRMGRFLMNVMLASGGYPWTVIPVEQRDNYMAALESASAGSDIKPLAEFVGYLVKATMKGKPVARV